LLTLPALNPIQQYIEWFGGRARAGQEFSNAVQSAVHSQFNVPTLNAFIAILICLEHSFWLTQNGSRPVEAFIKTFHAYIQEARAILDQKLEDYLKSKQSKDWFRTKYHPSPNECTEFRKIIFDNLLPRPNPSLGH